VTIATGSSADGNAWAKLPRPCRGYVFDVADKSSGVAQQRPTLGNLRRTLELRSGSSSDVQRMIVRSQKSAHDAIQIDQMRRRMRRKSSAHETLAPASGALDRRTAPSSPALRHGGWSGNQILPVSYSIRCNDFISE